MVTPSAAVVVRDATARDVYAVTQMLGAAFSGSRLGRWLDPDVQSRPGSLLACVTPVVAEATDAGIVRVIEDGGRVVAAAVWSLQPGRPIGDTRDLWPANSCRWRSQSRWMLLEELAQTHRPLHLAHQRLVLLGVHPERQGEALSSYLLIGHHALLHVTGVAAYALADESSYGLLQRHGYSAIGPPRLLPGRIPVWAMWRPPSPADLR